MEPAAPDAAHPVSFAGLRFPLLRVLVIRSQRLAALDLDAPLLGVTSPLRGVRFTKKLRGAL